MAQPWLAVEPPSSELVTGFARIRTELEVPAAFPSEVEAAAAEAAAAGPALPPGVPAVDPVDRRHIPFLTIDPPGSRDLDQAYCAERSGRGYVVHYAIADVAALVPPGDRIDTEARERGVTRYSPDLRTPLHPHSLGEGAASLLPGEDRWAVLWRVELDADGAERSVQVERAVVRSRAAATYAEVQAAIDAGTAEEPLVLLQEVGRLRQAQEAARGGVSLGLPTQKIVAEDGHYRLVYVTPPLVEGWNAEVSLLVGMAAGRIMAEGGVGLLRTVPPPDPRTVAAIRRSARALGVSWPRRMTYQEFVRGIDRSSPGAPALLTQAARALRGAGYLAFDGEVPATATHAAVAALYAHVTAPIRRLADRFANEVVLALAADRRPPEWAAAALPDMPSLMGDARRRERVLTNAIVDYMEAAGLEHRIGEVFDVTVTNIDERGAVIQLRDPAVLARIAPAGLTLGEQLPVRLVAADPGTRAVRFEPVGSVA